MTLRRTVAAAALALVLTVSFGASLAPGFSYTQQHREFTDAAPSTHFPLGTDDLGRDRMARLLAATRVSLVFAATAAFGAMALAAVLGGIAGYRGGWFDRFLMRVIDLMLSLPSLFLLLAARALLPLNAGPLASLLTTYTLLTLLGWAAPARVVRAGVRAFRESEFVLQARAAGLGEVRILFRHVLPNLRPILLAQFWTSIPLFILAEANLGFLGLSAGEPFPTWGSLLQELQSPLLARPESFAPVAAIALSVICFKLMKPRSAHAA